MRGLQYNVVRQGEHWGIAREDGNIEGDHHLTKESAFEAAALAASNAIRDGLEVTITVSARAPGESNWDPTNEKAPRGFPRSECLGGKRPTEPSGRGLRQGIRECIGPTHDGPNNREQHFQHACQG